METVAIEDTSICTTNLGDEIIMDSVNEIVWELLTGVGVLLDLLP